MKVSLLLLTATLNFKLIHEFNSSNKNEEFDVLVS